MQPTDRVHSSSSANHHKASLRVFIPVTYERHGLNVSGFLPGRCCTIMWYCAKSSIQQANCPFGSLKRKTLPNR
ncbi:hypothetical protein DPMN_157923 [Dreissena polymorpha]|uniref:Uncharacterized protein n=1 Tax=Dreissena polymorpha TaxID=45954 RepID=A0A9D4EI82_DREPO|nr:hypothetical protein DPMN_157923 [Dreissena polymorpha]